MTRSFLFLLGLAVVLGVGLGGAFIGGVAFGKARADATATNTLQAGPGFLQSGQSPGLSGQGQGPSSRLQQRSLGSKPNSGNASGSGPQFPGQGGAGNGMDGLAARGGLTGTVEGVEGNTVTIDTSQGLVKATIGENTAFTRVAESTVDDLRAGVQVRVMGDEVEGEGVAATSVTIIPEGAAGLPGGRGLPGARGPQTNQAGQ